jgi:nucleotide-binding universal stress UspA family protein
MEPFRHVLVATDFSECSSAATDAAVELARRYEAALTLVHVVEIPLAAYVGMVPAPIDLVTPIHEAAREQLQKALASVQKRFPAACARLEPTGSAWEHIVAAAREVKADLVVVGTHGRTGLSHALIGSVAERVVRYCRVPVLTIHASKPH